MSSDSFTVYRKEGFVEFVVSKIQIRIRKPIRKRIQAICIMSTYLGVYPICRVSQGRVNKSDTPQIDVIQIEHTSAAGLHNVMSCHDIMQHKKQ